VTICPSVFAWVFPHLDWAVAPNQCDGQSLAAHKLEAACHVKRVRLGSKGTTLRQRSALRCAVCSKVSPAATAVISCGRSLRLYTRLRAACRLVDKIHRTMTCPAADRLLKTNAKGFVCAGAIRPIF